MAERGLLEVLDLVCGPEEVTERCLLEVLDLVWGPEEVAKRGLWTSSGNLKNNKEREVRSPSVFVCRQSGYHT